MMRTHYCGSLTEAQIDQTVTLCGWVHRRRDHGGVIFLDMRDRDGLVQVVIDPDTPEAFATADKVRSEFVLKITGFSTFNVLVGYNRSKGKICMPRRFRTP